MICITGEWGVGKTYTWQLGLNEAKKTHSCALSRYSYASLFGVNSLDALKLTLVENLDFLDAAPETTVKSGLHFVKSQLTRATKLNQLASALPTIGRLFDKAGPLYFSMVRNQIVCIDDLERRGSSLDVKDVFGLISFLREQRSCKVVLLLNNDALSDEDKTKFDLYFEKAIDARLIFSPTAAEAVKIALDRPGKMTDLLRKHCEALKISNIRVIKRIERLALQLELHLNPFSTELIQQAIHSLTLFGWSKFQPNAAPPLDFYRISSMERYLEQRRSKTTASADEEKWNALLAQYNFTNVDEFDLELMKFVNTGVLDVSCIIASATIQDKKIDIQKRHVSVEQAWRPFHDSFDANIEEVTRSMVDGMKANLAVVSLSNLNSAIVLLKELGRDDEAQEILNFFVKNGKEGFWDSSADPFHRGAFEPGLAEVIERAKEVTAAAPFDTEAELIRAAQTYNQETIKVLADVPIDEYYRIIKSKNGEEMRSIIYAATGFRQISNASPEMREVVRRVEEALRKIGSESKLNAVRVQRFGVTVVNN